MDGLEGVGVQGVCYVMRARYQILRLLVVSITGVVPYVEALIVVQVNMKYLRGK